MSVFISVPGIEASTFSQFLWEFITHLIPLPAVFLTFSMHRFHLHCFHTISSLVLHVLPTPSSDSQACGAIGAQHLQPPACLGWHQVSFQQLL